jgi:predicted TIM-barrel fold metal-dependent hydrolase
VAGEVASLTNPALDSVLDFAGKVGLVVILHSDMDMPMAKPASEPVYLTQMKDLLRRHPQTTIIWAHIGLGRIVHPVGYGSASNSESSERPPNHVEIVNSILSDPAFSHVYFDISWDEVAKYIVRTPETIKAAAAVMNKYPDRFLFGTDVVAPPNQDFYLAVFNMYTPLWKALSPQTSEKIRKGNYARLFDTARQKVRTWEAANIAK